MGTQFSENVHQDASGVKLVSVGQNRGPLTGDEWITPMTMWELDETTGVYMPPGESNNPKSPRVRIDPKHIMLDDDGNEVVRIVNVAPWAYDAVDDTLKVKIGDTVSTSEENSQATLNRVMLLASEGKLEQVRALLNTQLANINTEVANVKNKLIAAPATEAKQNTANTSLATIATKTTATEEQLLLVKSELSNVKAELTAIKASLTDGTQKVSTVGNSVLLDKFGNEVNPTAELDDDGLGVPRVVEAAPRVYEDENDRFLGDTLKTGENVLSEIILDLQKRQTTTNGTIYPPPYAKKLMLILNVTAFEPNDGLESIANITLDTRHYNTGLRLRSTQMKKAEFDLGSGNKTIVHFWGENISLPNYGEDLIFVEGFYRGVNIPPWPRIFWQVSLNSVNNVGKGVTYILRAVWL